MVGLEAPNVLSIVDRSQQNLLLVVPDPLSSAILAININSTDHDFQFRIQEGPRRQDVAW